MEKNLYMVDCFNVIIEEIAPHFFYRYFSKGEAMNVKERYFHDIDLGKKTLEEFYKEVSQEYGMPSSDVKKVWDAPLHVNEGILPILEKLAKKGDVVLVSNAPKGFVEKAFEDLGLNRYFKKLYVSSAIGMIKPNRDIYEYVIRDQNENYKEMYMIDDNEANLKVLPSLHVHGILFTGNDCLKELL